MHFILALSLTLNGLFGFTPMLVSKPPMKPKKVMLKFEGIFRTPKVVIKSLESKPKAKAKPKQVKPRKIKVEATAYTAQCPGCIGITKTGVNLIKHPNKKVVAVDPKVIPLGSKLYVPGYGVAYASDTGGAIKGNHVDLYMKHKEKALNWGKKYLNITILKEG